MEWPGIECIAQDEARLVCIWLSVWEWIDSCDCGAVTLPRDRDRDKLQKVAAAGMLQPKLPAPGIWPKSTSQGMRPKLSSDLWPKSLSAVWNICLFPNFSDLNDLCSIYVTPDHAGVSHTFKFCSALVPLWKDNENSFKTIPVWLSRTCSMWCFFSQCNGSHTYTSYTKNLKQACNTCLFISDAPHANLLTWRN